MPEKRAAMDRWAEFLDAVLDGRVVDLCQRGVVCHSAPRRQGDPRLSLLHYQHLGYGARAVPIGRIDLLDPADLSPAVVLELRAAVPNGADIEFLLANIDGALRSWPLHMDVRAVTDCPPPLAAIVADRASWPLAAPIAGSLQSEQPAASAP